ncbi:MAG: sensor histidine kinase [Methanoculleaceae archaeon]
MAIKGYQDLAGSGEGEAALSDYLPKIEEEISRICGRIEFTREYESTGTKGPAWFSISDLIEGINDGVLPISLDGDGDGIEILADPMIGQFLSSLYDNTLRHASGASHVTVSCEKTGDNDLMVIWEDDGPGFPHGTKEQIFERRFGNNQGLSLFLAREILGITGITIRECGTPGAGARFEIRVPDGAWRHARLP